MAPVLHQSRAFEDAVKMSICPDFQRATPDRKITIRDSISHLFVHRHGCENITIISRQMMFDFATETTGMARPEALGRVDQ